MSGSDGVLFRELIARVDELEREVARLHDRVDGKDMMDEIGMRPEGQPPKRGPGRPPKSSYEEPDAA